MSHAGLNAERSLLAAAQMLTKDPAARVGLAAVMGHPWVTSGGQDPLQSMEQAGQVVRGGSALAPPRRGCRTLLVRLALCQEPLHSLEQAEQEARECTSLSVPCWGGFREITAAVLLGCLVPGNILVAVSDVPCSLVGKVHVRQTARQATCT